MKLRTKNILKILDEEYGTDIKCYLNYKKPYELLIATILSAQCTDKRVNLITKDLFKKYKKLEDFANANLNELENDIKSAGFYKNKARNIKACATKLIDNYNSKIPSDINELIKLDGVGRKTANVIRGNIFGIPSVVVDTHVGRISRRLGLTTSNNPEIIERDLMKEIDEDHWILINIQLITMGRTICKSLNPNCLNCRLVKYCNYYADKARK